MRLRALKLKNFRGYKGEVSITFEDLTALIGRNDVGKSTILDALEIFFNSSQAKFDSSDLCVHADDGEVRIGCIFTELPRSLVLDVNAETSLADEYLLNSDGNLEIHRIWTITNGRKSESIVAIANHPTATNVSGLLQKKNSDLKKIANDLNVDLSDVDTRSNPALRRAIWSSQPDLSLREVEVPLNKEDAKTIWQKLQKELPTFALFRADRPSTDDDAEVQDPMKLAIKEALVGVEDELERIKDKVREKALDVAARTLEKLRSIAPELAGELKPTFKNEPKWDGIFKLSLTSDDQIPINKRGSGVRRLVLLSFFRADAERRRREEKKHSIIYAIEEPETSQHPNNQRMLIKALLDLASEDDCQVIITTHVPALAGLIPIKGIRYITICEDGSRLVREGDDETISQIADELGVLPDERVRVLVCVEGPNDVSFLMHIADILRRDDPTVVDLRSDPRVVLLPLGGSTLQDWVNEHYLRPLGKPEIHIYDRDENDPPKYQEVCDRVNSRNDGSKGFITSKRELENYLHPEAIQKSLNISIHVDDDSDIPELVAQARHEVRYPDRPWDGLSSSARKKCISYAKRLLNEDVVKVMTTEMLQERGGKEEILSWFTAIKRHLD